MSIEKAKIGIEDLEIGAGTFNRKGRTGFDISVTKISLESLVDSYARLKLPSFAFADLPTAGTVGRLALVTDNIRGIWRDTGTAWVSVTGVADTDDFAGADIGVKINAIITAIGLGNPVVIRISRQDDYSYSTSIDLTSTENVRITGFGSNLSTLNNRKPNLIWTGGAGTGPAIKAPGAIGLEIDHLSLTYNNSAFNGYLISLATTGAPDTSTANIHHNSITGTSTATGAAGLIELDTSERIAIEKNSFRYGVTAIKSTAGSNNVIAIRDNWFQSDFTSAKIVAWGNAWTIESNVFEDGTTLIAALDQAGDVQGLRFVGNQMVDGGTGGGTLFDLRLVTKGVEISGNSFTAASGTAILASSTAGNSLGWSIRGNYISGMTTGINLAVAEGVEITGNVITATTPWTGTNPTRLWITGNDFGLTTTSGLSVTNANTILLSRSAIKGSGLIAVYSIEDNAQALYMLNGTGNSVSEVSDPAGIFSPTAGTATSLNIYYSSANGRYELENLRGSTRTIIVNSVFGR